MNDSQCVAFLQWALPRLGLRWSGFRKVRQQICHRARRRARELGLPDLNGYRTYLESHPEEWAVLDTLTPITISRFYRDHGTFEFLATEVLPTLAALAGARGSGSLEAWSAGCASGEEPYTLAIIWKLALAARFPALSLRILATDIHPAMLTRARQACFSAASLKDLPQGWRAAAFVQQDGLLCLREPYKQPVTIASHDIRTGPVGGPFDLVMCRNLVFTYFDQPIQRTIGAWFAQSLRPGGALVLGAHEQLPTEIAGFAPWSPDRAIFRRVAPVLA